MTDYLVAEVSKNWRAGVEVATGSGLLSQQFERVIAVNRDRGYVLHSFQLHRMMTGRDVMNETIVAVFVREASEMICACGHARQHHTAWGSCMTTDCACAAFTLAMIAEAPMEPRHKALWVDIHRNR